MDTQFYLNNLWKWKCDLLEDEEIPMGKSQIGNLPSLEEIEKIRVNLPEFEELQKLGNNRLVLAAFRYSLYHDPINYNCRKEARKRLDKYEETHNIEHLVDCFNFIRIEYLRAKMLKFPFESIDDGEHAQKIKS